MNVLNIVITGNPVDGLEFYGPFEEGEEANEWADEHLTPDDKDWWITSLIPPG